MRVANDKQTERARRLRRASTNAELKLWYRLRSRTLGYKFVRQEPIGPFTVDLPRAAPRCRSRRWPARDRPKRRAARSVTRRTPLSRSALLEQRCDGKYRGRSR